MRYKSLAVVLAILISATGAQSSAQIWTRSPEQLLQDAMDLAAKLAESIARQDFDSQDAANSWFTDQLNATTSTLASSVQNDASADIVEAGQTVEERGLLLRQRYQAIRLSDQGGPMTQEEQQRAKQDLRNHLRAVVMAVDRLARAKGVSVNIPSSLWSLLPQPQDQPNQPQPGGTPTGTLPPPGGGVPTWVWYAAGGGGAGLGIFVASQGGGTGTTTPPPSGTTPPPTPTSQPSANGTYNGSGTIQTPTPAGCSIFPSGFSALITILNTVVGTTNGTVTTQFTNQSGGASVSLTGQTVQFGVQSVTQGNDGSVTVKANPAFLPNDPRIQAFFNATVGNQALRSGAMTFLAPQTPACNYSIR